MPRYSPAPAAGNLHVRVNDELVLDAGRYETVLGSEGPQQVIHPPKRTLYDQVLTYLVAKPDAPGTYAGRYREGAAIAAVTLRWGSYLAVLLDRDKPRWNVPVSDHVSRISNGEMARINIEASAAMASWIDLLRQDRTGETYRRLVNRALTYLPMPKMVHKVRPFGFGALTVPSVAAKLIQPRDPAWVDEARAKAAAQPSRLLANAAVNCAWRNGPVEDFHAGHARGYPLDKRRIGVFGERRLMNFASAGLQEAVGACRDLAVEQPSRARAEQVLPFGLAEELRITPENWTLTESSREIRLPVSNENPADQQTTPSAVQSNM